MSSTREARQPLLFLFYPQPSNAEAVVAQNVAAGVAGLVIPVLWFGMDFKGAASKEVTALQARQQYLTTLATERCGAQARAR